MVTTTSILNQFPALYTTKRKKWILINHCYYHQANKNDNSGLKSYLTDSIVAKRQKLNDIIEIFTKLI